VRAAAAEVINLTKNVGKIPTFDIVLVGERLFFFHCLRLVFSLNLVRCGDKESFRAVVGGEKAALAGLKMQILRYVCMFLGLCVYIYVYVRMCVCMYACMYVNIYVYVLMCVCMHVCMYVCMYLCMYVCLCI
jgi:hypothetical protein